MPREKSRLPRLLPTLILCLCGTILFKTASLIGAAFAGNAASTGPAAATSPTPAPLAAPVDAPRAGRHPGVSNWTLRPPPPPLCKPDPLDLAGERKILLNLRQRAKELDARAARLDQQEQTLAAARAALKKQADALKPVAARLEAMNTAHRTADNRKWAALVSTFATMDPRSAARIFDGLDPQIVLNVLKRMESRKSALILANMSPEKAQAVTARLAGLKSNAASVLPAASLLPDGAP